MQLTCSQRLRRSAPFNFTIYPEPMLSKSEGQWQEDLLLCQAGRCRGRCREVQQKDREGDGAAQ